MPIGSGSRRRRVLRARQADSQQAPRPAGPRTFRAGYSLYEHALEEAGRQLRARVKPGDLVVLHDAQTAGLAKAAKLAGAQVIWRCHVGRDVPNDSGS